MQVVAPSASVWGPALEEEEEHVEKQGTTSF